MPYASSFQALRPSTNATGVADPMIEAQRDGASRVSTAQSCSRRPQTLGVFYEPSTSWGGTSRLDARMGNYSKESTPRGGGLGV